MIILSWNCIFLHCCFSFGKHTKDFLGKVKDKAGDMEKRLKDKDKHGIVSISSIVTDLFSFFFLIF